MDLNLNKILNDIYLSLEDDNSDIDKHIKLLKEVLSENNSKTIEIDKSRLVQNNREGRKRMQSYFKKRGVLITFKK